VTERQSTPDAGTRRRRLAWFFILGMLWLNLLFFIDFRKGIGRGYTDFTVFYTAGTILRQGLGHQLYDRQVQYKVQLDFAGHIPFRRGPLPYIHPPFEAIIFVPLSLLPYKQAFVAWNLLCVGGLFGVAALLRRTIVALRLIPPWKFVVASVAFFPVFACFLQGQDSILMLLFCALAFNALKRQSDVLAGCWMALGAFKFQFIVPIVLLFVIWNRRRVAVGFGAVAAVLAALSVALAGVDALLKYPEYVMRIVKNPGLGGVPPELLPNIHGLAQGWPSLFSEQAGAVLATVASVTLLLFAAWKGRSSSRPGNLELQFSLAVAISGLIAWQTNAHDLSLLVLPLVLTADYCVRTSVRGGAARFALLFPVLPVLISPLWMALWLLVSKVNLMAIPLVWWTLAIGWELSRERVKSGGVGVVRVAGDVAEQ
jgi:hypothetical protein